MGAYDRNIINNTFLRVRDGAGYSIARLRGVNRGGTMGSDILYLALVKGESIIVDFKGIDTVSNKAPSHREVCEWVTALRACGARVPMLLELKFCSFVVQITEESVSHKNFQKPEKIDKTEKEKEPNPAGTLLSCNTTFGVSVSEHESSRSDVSSTSAGNSPPPSNHVTPKSSFRRKVSRRGADLFKNPLLHSAQSFHSPVLCTVEGRLVLFYSRYSPLSNCTADTVYEQGKPAFQSTRSDSVRSERRASNMGLSDRKGSVSNFSPRMHRVSSVSSTLRSCLVKENPHSYSCASCSISSEGTFMPYTDMDFTPKGFFNCGPPVKHRGKYYIAYEMKRSDGGDVRAHYSVSDNTTSWSQPLRLEHSDGEITGTNFRFVEENGALCLFSVGRFGIHKLIVNGLADSEAITGEGTVVLHWDDLEATGITEGSIKSISVTEGLLCGGSGWTLLLTFDAKDEDGASCGGRVISFICSTELATWRFSGEINVRKNFSVAETATTFNHIHCDHRGCVDAVDSASLHLSSWGEPLWYLVLSCKVQGETANRVVIASSLDHGVSWTILDFHDLLE